MGNNEKLIVEFWQIENVVNMRVVNQPDTIERGCGVICKLHNICVASGEYPRIDFSANTLYVNGRHRDSDNKITCYSFKNDEQASEFIDNAITCITIINYILENNRKFCVSVDDNGIRNCIAGVNSDDWGKFKNEQI